MKTNLNRFFLPLPLAILTAIQVTAQAWINSDGANPYAGLITNSSGDTLYGTALNAGASGFGTIFAVNTNGSGFTILHSFNGDDGAYPRAALVLSGNVLYGTAGAVFRINTDGTGFATLSGAGSYAGLVLSGSTLYGTTQNGGDSGSGAIFAINTDGTGFTNLYSFTATITNSFGDYTNSDGAHPHAGLILSGNTLYGTANGGGSSGNGTVFSINTDGTGFKNLHTFTTTYASMVFIDGGTVHANTDGANPIGGLILSDKTLYGTASAGGDYGGGVLFALNTDSTGFTNLHSFHVCCYLYWGTDDGASPEPGLILSGNKLYGTTQLGGASSNGTVFAVNTDGTGFTNLHNFTAYSASYNGFANGDGAQPIGGLILLGRTLYGTGSNGGIYGDGTVFAVNADGTDFANLHNFTALTAPPLPAPQLTMTIAGTNILLTWPSAFEWGPYGDIRSYHLQSATSLGSSAVWTRVRPGPVVLNGQKVLTNIITGGQQFYRLIWVTGSYPIFCDDNSVCFCGECVTDPKTFQNWCGYSDGSPCDD